MLLVFVAAFFLILGCHSLAAGNRSRLQWTCLFSPHSTCLPSITSLPPPHPLSTEIMNRTLTHNATKTGGEILACTSITSSPVPLTQSPQIQIHLPSRCLKHALEHCLQKHTISTSIRYFQVKFFQLWTAFDKCKCKCTKPRAVHLSCNFYLICSSRTLGSPRASIVRAKAVIPLSVAL